MFKNYMGSAQAKMAMVFAMALGAFGPAFAVIDVSAVTSGITDVGVALLAVIGGFLAVSVLILGIGKVYSFVKRKAGA